MIELLLQFLTAVALGGIIALIVVAVEKFALMGAYCAAALDWLEANHLWAVDDPAVGADLAMGLSATRCRPADLTAETVEEVWLILRKRGRF